MIDPYLQKLGDLWRLETGQKFLAMSRHATERIMHFKDPEQPGVILIKLPLSHVERVLRGQGYDLNSVKMEALG